MAVLLRSGSDTGRAGGDGNGRAVWDWSPSLGWLGVLGGGFGQHREISINK